MRWATVWAGFAACAGSQAPSGGDAAPADGREGGGADSGAADGLAWSDFGVAPDGLSGACPTDCVFPVADHVDLTYVVWGEEGVHFYIPRPAWAMAAVHGARLLAYYLGGALDRTVSPNWFLATALKESRLGCCPDEPEDAEHPPAAWTYQAAAAFDGCFQIESTTAFVEMQRIFPAHFEGAAHADLIAGCNVESSALTMAFYDAFAFGMMYAWIDDPESFFADATDPGAFELTFSIAYNRGAWSNEFQSAIGECATAEDVLGCVFGEVSDVPTEQPTAYDHAYSIWRYVQDLDQAARDGACYDAALTSDEVRAYVEAVAPPLQGDAPALADEAVAAFETAAGGASGAFQAHFGAVLEVLEASPFENPFPQLASWYGVPSPPGGGAFAWPDVASTCQIIE